MTWTPRGGEGADVCRVPPAREGAAAGVVESVARQVSGLWHRLGVLIARWGRCGFQSSVSSAPTA